MTKTWVCYARPARLGGSTCGHVNECGILHGSQRLLCCESCGATKYASDDRLKRGDIDPNKRSKSS